MSLHAVIAQLEASDASIQLTTIDLAFLVTLRWQMKHEGRGGLEQDEILDLYGRVAERVDPTTINAAKKASENLEKLVRSRMVSRVERGRTVFSADYDLSGLGQAIADHYLEERTLTRRDLRVLTGELKGQLHELVDKALAAETTEDWVEIAAAIRGPVVALAEGLDLRRRGLDAEQDEVKAEIVRLLDDEGRDPLESLAGSPWREIQGRTIRLESGVAAGIAT